MKSSFTSLFSAPVKDSGDPPVELTSSGAVDDELAKIKSEVGSGPAPQALESGEEQGSQEQAR